MKKELKIISWCEEHNCPIIEEVHFACLKSLKDEIEKLEGKLKSND